MGLPLFVAPVESDLPSKAADKSRATSPARSSIRRHARPDSRGRRSMARRHAALHERMAALRQSTSAVRDMSPLPWVESGFPPENDSSDIQSSSRPRPFREVLREMARSDERRTDRSGDGLNSVFGLSWQDDDNTTRADNDRSEMDMGWWTFESQPRFARRSRNTTTQPNRSESRFETAARTPSGLSSIFAEQRRRIERRFRETISDRSELEEQQRLLRIRALNRPREVNGLGDRDRSLSPEVWDTLLTTLTPDPQPPSAGSSFASTAASQNAGASSSTSLTTPDATNEAYLIDPGCDSGCDNSDTEGAQYDSMLYLPRTERRRTEPTRRVRLRVPQRFMVDGPIDRPARAASNDRDGSASVSTSTARQQRPTENSMMATAADAEGSASFSSLRDPRSAWVGHLSVGTSDDEQGTDRRSLNREGSTVSANLTSQGEDDWSGMQRIVRSLARREDIPDEWWAEAGLSRTLPGDGTE